MTTLWGKAGRPARGRDGEEDVGRGRDEDGAAGGFVFWLEGLVGLDEGRAVEEGHVGVEVARAVGRDGRGDVVLCPGEFGEVLRSLGRFWRLSGDWPS